MSPEFTIAMPDTSFDGLRAFLAVAELSSFTAAAARLGVTTTAVSKSVKLLETRHGAVLLRRTTRSVALTDAGAALAAMLRDAVGQIDDAFATLHAANGRPSGTLRLTMPRALGALQIAPLAERMRQRCPDVTLDIALDDGTVDLVAAGFDAGIRLGQSVAQDMVAVRITPDLHWSVLAAPAYLARCGRPHTPEALTAHQSLRFRFPASGALHRWGFVRDGQAFHVDTGGGVIVNDTTLIRQFALAGMGLAYLPDLEAAADIAAGRLERVLAPFVPTTSGLFIYFPVRTQHQPKLRAFIDLAREQASAAGIPDWA